MFEGLRWNLKGRRLQPKRPYRNIVQLIREGTLRVDLLKH
jgi:hypothetical protein